MPRGYPGTAKAKAPTQAALLADVILELQLVNASSERIETQRFPAIGASISKLSTETTLSIADLHDPLDNIFETLKRTFDYFVGNDLQVAEDRKEMLAALEGIRSATSVRNSSTNTTVPGADPKGDAGSASLLGSSLLFGGLFGAGLAVVTAGFVTGFVAEVAKQFAKTVKLIRKGILGERLAERWSKSFNWLVGENGMLSKIGRLFSKESAFGKFFGGIAKFGRKMVSFVSKIGIMGVFNSPMGWFVKIEKVLGPLFKIGKVFGKILGKLAAPITILTALWDTIKGVYEGYKKDGIGGALRGATIELFNSLIGWVVDIVKGGVSWIANKLGFSELSKTLDAWNFKDFFTKIFDSITGAINPLAEKLGETMSTPGKFKEWIDGVVDSLWVILKSSTQMLLDVLKKQSEKQVGDLVTKFTGNFIAEVLKVALPKWDNSSMLGALSPNNVAVAALKNAGVYEYAGISPDSGKSIAITPSKTGSTVSKESPKENSGNTTVINNYGGTTNNSSSSASSSSINTMQSNAGKRSFAGGMDFGFGY